MSQKAAVVTEVVEHEQYRLDKNDLAIIRMLSQDCRRSYRSIALTLGVTTNTIKLRIQKLIANNIIEKFVTNLNRTLLFDEKLSSCILIVRGKDSDNIAQRLSLIGDLFLQVDCLGGVSVFKITIRDEKTKKRIISSLATSLKHARIYDLFMSKLPYRHITFNDTDLRIVKCLIQKPRISISDTAKAISLSEKTIQRRLDRMQRYNLLEFTLLPNPAAIRGYIYFGMIISLEKLRYENVIRYIYSELEQHFLPPPPVISQEIIILSLCSDNFFDIEKILRNVKSLEGVKQVEVFQPIRMRYSQTSLIKEIDKRLANKSNTRRIMATIKH